MIHFFSLSPHTQLEVKGHLNHLFPQDGRCSCLKPHPKWSLSTSHTHRLHPPLRILVQSTPPWPIALSQWSKFSHHFPPANCELVDNCTCISHDHWLWLDVRVHVRKHNYYAWTNCIVFVQFDNTYIYIYSVHVAVKLMYYYCYHCLSILPSHPSPQYPRPTSVGEG